MTIPRILVFLACLTLAASSAADETVWLGSLDLSRMRQAWGRPKVDASMSGKPLSIGGRKFEHGVGTHARSTLWIDLDGGSERFLAFAGVDDAAGGRVPAMVRFTIIGDGQRLWDSGPMRKGQEAKAVDLDIRGVKKLLLLAVNVSDRLTTAHANWAEARFIVRGPKPLAGAGPSEPAVILTPPPPPSPRINGPRIVGCRPGHPFLFRVPTTGERPIRFTSADLPPGISLDATSGILSGTAPPRGEYRTTLVATNAHGSATRELRISAGDRLALTPPMGWNHWYAHRNRVTDAIVREAAEVMVRSGMADAGYQYVNIDDCWMNTDNERAKRPPDPLRLGPMRDAQGNIIPNRHFPDMRALTDFIHSKGLKAGIYSSPGPLTCGGYAGSYQHEEQDARQFAAWGFDFLKYDWCSYRQVVNNDQSVETLKKPYLLMGGLLQKQPRDIVFNLCEYGWGDVWTWGAEVGGHCWRTADDLGYELDRIFEVALNNAAHRDWQKPGAWNDPDYIQIGWIGDSRTGGQPAPCPLTPNEQYSFMSLWCLMASPLIYSGDMSRLDEFTLNILCNPEVIEIDQDPLGECARVLTLDDDTFLMVKNVEGGDKAVGLCNRGEIEAAVTARWSDLGIEGKHVIRDLWRQTDLGEFDGEFTAKVPHRSVLLLRVRPAALPGQDATDSEKAEPAPAGPPALRLVNDSVLEPEALNFAQGTYGTCINGQTFQIEAAVSFQGWQYATWFDSRGRLCVGRRRLPGGSWQRIAFDDYTIRHSDVHNVAVIGICPADGTIHLAFDHHGSPLHYRVSRPGAATAPQDTDWTAALFGPTTSELVPAQKLDRVTYPAFFTTPGGRLQLSYRIGGSGDGDSHLAEYDPDRGGWSILGEYISGRGDFQGSATRNAYHNGFDYDAGGRLHTTWVWREGQDNAQWGLLNCHGLQYAFSDDGGRQWRNNRGEPIGLAGREPMRLESPGITVHPLRWRWGLMNQLTQTVDHRGRVHVVLWQNPFDAPAATKDMNAWRYYHYWRDEGGAWRQQQLPFFGRKPSIVADRSDNLFVVFTKPANLEYHGTDPGGPLHIFATSPARDWTDWHEVYRSQDSFVGEPRIDKYRWQGEQVLSVYAQQTPIEAGKPSPLRILDFEPDR